MPGTPDATQAAPPTPDVSTETGAKAPSAEAPQAEPASAEQRGVAMALAEAAQTPPPGPENALHELSNGAIRVESTVSDPGTAPIDRAIAVSADDISPIGGDGAATNANPDTVMPGQRNTDAAAGGSLGDAADLENTVTVASNSEPAGAEASSVTPEVSDADLMRELEDRITRMINNDPQVKDAKTSQDWRDARRSAGAYATMTEYDRFVRENPEAAARIAAQNEAMQKALDRKAAEDARRAEAAQAAEAERLKQEAASEGRRVYAEIGSQYGLVIAEGETVDGLLSKINDASPTDAQWDSNDPDIRRKVQLAIDFSEEQRKAAALARETENPPTQEEINQACFDNIVQETADGKPGIPITAKSDVDTVIQTLIAQRGEVWNPSDEEGKKKVRHNVEAAIAHAKKLEGVADVSASEDTTTEGENVPETSGMVTQEQVQQIVDAALEKQGKLHAEQMEALTEKIKGGAELTQELALAIQEEDEKKRAERIRKLLKRIGAFLAGFVSGAIITTTEDVADIATNPGQHAQ
jgi:hypothetical protein